VVTCPTAPHPTPPPPPPPPAAARRTANQPATYVDAATTESE
jgi:hypothetical protein